MKIKDKFYDNKLIDIDEVNRLIDALYNSEGKSIMSLLPKNALDALMQYKDNLFTKVENSKISKEDAFKEFKKARQDAFDQNPESVVAIHKKGTNETLIYDLNLSDLLGVVEGLNANAISNEELRQLDQEAEIKVKKDAINQGTHQKIFELLGVDSVEKAKEKQLNANARVSELLANKVFKGELTEAEMLELQGIKTAFTKVQGFLADGRNAKAEIKV